jgi:hypothetical protein
MKKYSTFESAELSSTITSLGYNLHKIAEHIIYFKQYAKLQGTEHDFLPDSAIITINKCIRMFRHDFNLSFENNACLEIMEGNRIEEIIKKCNTDHDNPYKKTIPKYKELVKQFLTIAENEGKDANWDDITNECKKML